MSTSSTYTIAPLVSNATPPSTGIMAVSGMFADIPGTSSVPTLSGDNTWTGTNIFSGPVSFTGGAVEAAVPATALATAVTGDTCVIPAGVECFVVSGSAGLSALTISLPSLPNYSLLRVKFLVPVTTITWTLVAGQSVLSGTALPTTASAGTVVELQTINGTWCPD